ncbi:MAG: PQ-loop domain-containing transporter [Candidatus Peribacteraceae bacterium]|nr:PQ-loop domain-containing transporter [Candidatus Peribacteraceae bacterium]MDD5074915.1 PQ-loop domain-containing transporter [Candidatus Peribacteraceae bacterium]
MYVELLGYVSGGLITVALLPQVIKSWRTKSTKDISIPWMILYQIGLLLSIAYGVCIASMPFILTTIVEFLLATSLLVLKCMYR